MASCRTRLAKHAAAGDAAAGPPPPRVGDGGQPRRISRIPHEDGGVRPRQALPPSDGSPSRAGTGSHHERNQRWSHRRSTCDAIHCSSEPRR